MAKKPRKMLGDISSPSCKALQDLIDSSSKETVRLWCLGFAKDRVLPIFEKHCPNDDRPRRTVEAAFSYIEGKVAFPTVKNLILNECHAAARELNSNPTAQAAARAIGQGSAVVHTLDHSMGLYLYAAAAIAYDKLGLSADEEEYLKIAEQVLFEYTAALEHTTTKYENHPHWM